ncbi:MAG: Na+/H+ antiporter subunit E [PVC group bacterium]
MKSKIILFILGFLVWMGLTWPPQWQEILVGAAVSLLVALLTGDMFVERPHHFKDFRRYLWFLYYLPVLAWECLKANIDVAYRVAHPRLPIKPGIVKVKTVLKSNSGLTFLANSITLTPGTLTVDVDREQGVLYIHWIYVRDKDIEEATRLIVTKFERILQRIFE